MATLASTTTSKGLASATVPSLSFLSCFMIQRLWVPLYVHIFSYPLERLAQACLINFRLSSFWFGISLVVLRRRGIVLRATHHHSL